MPLEFLPDCLQYAVEVRQHVVVPEPNDPIPETCKLSTALRVFGRVLGVLSAIQFYDEFPGRTGEVRDIAADGSLTPEPIRRRTPTQRAPQNLFRVRGISP